MSYGKQQIYHNLETEGMISMKFIISGKNIDVTDALRSAVVAQGTDDEMFYLVLARQAKQLRRDYMNKHFSEIDNKLWCLCKSTACLRQLAYETWAEGAEMLTQIDQIVDDVWGKAIGKDLSDCESCKDDRKA